MKEDNKQQQTLFKELWDRRVFQILGIYMGASWAVLEFISSFLVDRFNFSIQLISISIIMVTSLLPSILMVAWFHGRPGPDKWHRIEKIGIPINFFIILVTIFFVVRGNSLDAGTSMDNKGGNVNSVVSEKEDVGSQKIRIVIWNFESEFSDSSLDYLNYGMPQLLFYSLNQNMVFNITTQYDYGEDILEKNVLDKNKISLSLMREITKSNNYEYFLTAGIKKENNKFIVHCRLYNADNFEMKFENYLEANNLYTIVDSMTYCINEKLMPTAKNSHLKIIPNAELLTDNMDALKTFLNGRHQFFNKNDFSGAIQSFEKAVKIDSDFQYAYFELLKLYSITNQRNKIETILQPIMEKQYKLPEQDRYFVKYYYYLFNNEMSKAEAILDIWEDLFPKDTRPLYRRAWNHYINQARYAEAIQEYEKILEIEPQADELLLALGNMYFHLRNPVKARKFFNDYIKIHPDQLRGYLALAKLEKDTGGFNKAETIYDKILLMQENLPAVLVDKAEMAISHAEFSDAEVLLAKALSHSKTSADSMACLQMLSYRESFRGNFIGALRYRILKDNISKRVLSPMVILLDKLDDVSMFINMGEVGVAFDIIEEMKKLNPPLNSVYLAGKLEAYTLLKDEKKIKETIVEIEQSDLHQLLGLRAEAMVVSGRATIYEINGEFQKATAAYEKVDNLNPDNYLSNLLTKSRNYRLSGDYDRAEKLLHDMMALIPALPEMHFELAQLRWEQELKQEAINHMSIALEVWKIAHPNYKLAKEAKGLMRRWKILM
ncbi:MAG: tetratricopeptide repeat protein [Candidatus Marinimicrobia bacterium]|nr:tetratricopeptide repeat protein [Candidatus Neomarinimicrobiota bacterium]